MNNKWASFLNTILGIPGAKVNRESFIRQTFRHQPESVIRQCIAESPIKVLPAAEVEKAASSTISSHTIKVTGISALAGIPGGLGMLATIPADLANYYYHVVVVGQKLGYLYGFPDMVERSGNLTPDGEIMLTAFIGVMNKVEMAKELVKKLAVEVAKRLPEEAVIRIAGNILSKQIFAQVIEVVSTKLGKQIAVNGAGRGLYKAIPLLSGVICGGITYATFKPQAKRLHEALRDHNGATEAKLLD